jgi:tetratricopeptide (TPR) repeat protein
MLGVMEPWTDAIEWNRRAIQLAENSPDPAARRWIGTLYINLGSKLQDLHDYPAAQDAFSRAISTAEMPLPPGEAGRRPGEGLSSTPTRSVSEGATSSLSPSRIRLARLCLAKNLRLSGDPAAALPLQQQLLTEIDAAGENNGYSHEEIAECLLALGRARESQPHFALAYSSLSTYHWFPPNESPRLARIMELAR